MVEQAISLEQVSAATYLSVFGFGVLISFSPCVYPIIPVVVSYLGGTQVKTRAAAFTRSLLYVLGMSVMYALLGAVAALSGGVFGQFQNTWWVQVLVANIFLVMALFMLDVFQLPALQLARVPQGVLANQALGPLVMGAVSGLVMGPCTTPVLGALLAYVAGGRNVLLGTTLMLTYALGMGLPLLVLGTFAGMLQRLPRAGEWMGYIKKIFALVLVIAAEYLLLQVR